MINNTYSITMDTRKGWTNKQDVQFIQASAGTCKLEFEIIHDGSPLDQTGKRIMLEVLTPANAVIEVPLDVENGKLVKELDMRFISQGGTFYGELSIYSENNTKLMCTPKFNYFVGSNFAEQDVPQTSQYSTLQECIMQTKDVQASVVGNAEIVEASKEQATVAATNSISSSQASQASADSARQTADLVTDVVEMAKASAEASQASAVSSSTSASEAEKAKQAAIQAATVAAQASVTANTASINAEQALQTNTLALTQTQEAKDYAVSARTQAEQAQASATAASALLDTKIVEVNDLKQSVIATTNVANSANDTANTNLTRIEQLTADVESATNTANNAVASTSQSERNAKSSEQAASQSAINANAEAVKAKTEADKIIALGIDASTIGKLDADKYDDVVADVDAGTLTFKAKGQDKKTVQVGSSTVSADKVQFTGGETLTQKQANTDTAIQQVATRTDNKVKLNNENKENFNFIGSATTISALEADGKTYHIAGQKGDKGDPGTASVAIDDSITNAQQTWSSEKIDILLKKKPTYYSNIEQMKLDNSLKIGDIAVTLGYFNPNDGGGCEYVIETIENHILSQPKDISSVVFGADGYGNHSLSNGLIASIKDLNKVCPEHWGAKGNDKTFNNTLPFIHMFSRVRSGRIDFMSDSIYYFDDIYPIENPYKNSLCGNVLGGYKLYKPLLGNVNGLTIYGNGATLAVVDEGYAKQKRYDIDFSIFNLSGMIKNLTIKNLTFDGNGFNQKIVNAGTRNHNIAYIGADSNIFPDGHGINGLLIDQCIFKNGGYNVTQQDQGGDGILIICAPIIENLHIINNRFENCGRWAVAIDLGGSSLYAHKNFYINNNYYVQTDDQLQLTVDNKCRGLGFVDFEYYSKWENINVCHNKIVAPCVGFAWGGGDEATVDGFSYIGNDVICTELPRKGYGYLINIYNKKLIKNIKISNNSINMGVGYESIISIKNHALNLEFVGNMIFENLSSGNVGILNFDKTTNPSKIGGILNISDNISITSKSKRRRLLSISNWDTTVETFLNVKNNKANEMYLRAFEYTDAGIEKLNLNIAIDDNSFDIITGAVWSSKVVFKPSTNISFKEDYWYGEVNAYGVLRGAYYFGDYPMICGPTTAKYPPVGLVNGTSKATVANKAYNYMICTSGKTWKSAIKDAKEFEVDSSIDYEFSANLEIVKGRYLYTSNDANGRLYYVTQSGQLSNAAPTHKVGIQDNGTAKLLYVSDVAVFKTVTLT